MQLTKRNSLIVVDNGHWATTHDLQQAAQPIVNLGPAIQEGRLL